MFCFMPPCKQKVGGPKIFFRSLIPLICTVHLIYMTTSLHCVTDDDRRQRRYHTAIPTLCVGGPVICLACEKGKSVKTAQRNLKQGTYIL